MSPAPQGAESASTTAGVTASGQPNGSTTPATSAPAAGPPEPVLSPEIRRERLLMRSQTLRRQIAADAQVFKPPLALVDQLRDGLRWLARNPEWPAGVLVFLLVARPAVALRWGMRAWSGWQLWRRARRFMAMTPVRRQA